MIVVGWALNNLILMLQVNSKPEKIKERLNWLLNQIEASGQQETFAMEGIKASVKA
jgi:hypothetical protein